MLLFSICLKFLSLHASPRSAQFFRYSFLFRARPLPSVCYGQPPPTTVFVAERWQCYGYCWWPRSAPWVSPTTRHLCRRSHSRTSRASRASTKRPGSREWHCSLGPPVNRSGRRSLLTRAATFVVEVRVVRRTKQRNPP